MVPWFSHPVAAIFIVSITVRATTTHPTDVDLPVLATTNYPASGPGDNHPDADEDLPDVDSILSEASNTVKGFLDTATDMQNLANVNHEQSGLALTKVKQKYERRLQMQAENNTHVGKMTDDFRYQVDALKKGNHALHQDAKQLRKRNHILRESLWVLTPRMRIAVQFMGDTLKVANEGTDSEELQVLVPPKPEPSLDNFLHILRDGEPAALASANEDGTHMSLLQMTRKHRETKKDPTPEGLIGDLAQSIEKMELAQQEGADHLEADFLAHLEKKQKEYKELMVLQDDVKDELVEQKEQQTKLHHAKSRLTSTGLELDERVKAVRQFVQFVSSDVHTSLEKVRVLLNQVSP